MQTLTQAQIYSLIGQAIALLQARGYALSVEQHLRFLSYLQQFGDNSLTREQLSHLIAPFFSRSPEEQNLLHACLIREALLLEPRVIPDNYSNSDPIEENPELTPSDPATPVTDEENNPLKPPQGSSTDTPTQPQDNTNPPTAPPPASKKLENTPNQPTAPQAPVVGEVKTYNSAPFVWNIQLGSALEVQQKMNTGPLVKQMRQRQSMEDQDLDVEQTVKNWALNPGQVQLYYRQMTQAPSYLFLIDRRAQNDHRANLFNLLYNQLRGKDVQIERFFFYANPKICFNDKHPYGLEIGELYQMHRNDRLVVLTFGNEFFNPSDGDWFDWTKIFLQWKERMLLSPNPLDQWSGWEQKLTERFVLHPASFTGLHQAIEHLNQTVLTHRAGLIPPAQDAIQQKVFFQENLLKTLKTYFPNLDLRKWIAACTLYPQLHWELTLQLGALLAQHYQNPQLNSLENLLQLTRLPWFVDGKIPDASRIEMIKWLDLIGEEKPLRALLLKALEDAPSPPDDSAAYADFRMQVVFNQWMLEKDPELRAKLEKEFADFLKSGKKPDFVTLNRINRVVELGDFVVSESWREKFRISLDGEFNQVTYQISREELLKLIEALLHE